MMETVENMEGIPIVFSSVSRDGDTSSFDIPSPRTPAGTLNRFPSRHGHYCPSYVDEMKSKGGAVVKKEIPEQVSTVPSSVFNLVNTILGAGVIAFAYGIRSTGLLAGVVLVIIYVLISAFTLRILFKAWINARTNYNTHLGSYQDFIEFYLGRYMMICFEVFLLFYIFGALIVYLTVVGDSFSPMAGELFGTNVFYGNKKFVTFTFCSLVSYPLSCFRKVHMLRYASCISVCSVLLLIIMIPVSFIDNWIRTGEALHDLETSDLFLNTNLDKGIYPQFFMTLPLLSFAFDCHILAPNMAKELKKPKMWKFNTIVGVSISVVASMYLALGICGYLRFGNSIQPDILLSFKGDTGSILDFIIALVGRLALGVVGSTSYPLMVFPFRDSVLSIYGHFRGLCCPSRSKGKGSTKKKAEVLGTVPFILVTTFAFFVSVSGAMYLPNIGIIMGFVGAIGGTTTMYLFPFLMLWRCVPPPKKEREKVMQKTTSFIQIEEVELEQIETKICQDEEGVWSWVSYLVQYRCCSIFGVCFSCSAIIAGFLATIFSLIEIATS